MMRSDDQTGDLPRRNAQRLADQKPDARRREQTADPHDFQPVRPQRLLDEQGQQVDGLDHVDYHCAGREPTDIRAIALTIGALSR